MTAFHRAGLEDGAMPLNVLEGKIERWISAQSFRGRGPRKLDSVASELPGIDGRPGPLMALDAEHNTRQVAPQPSCRLAANFGIRFVKVRAA